MAKKDDSTIFDEEVFYDKRIAPLVAKLIDLCEDKRIHMVASFLYARDETGEEYLCTTSVPGRNGQNSRTLNAAVDLIQEGVAEGQTVIIRHGGAS